MTYTIYKTLGEGSSYVMTDEVKIGAWSGDTGSLSAIYTSSAQFGLTGEFYYDLYNLNPSGSDSAEVQFSVAYGHVSGSGSPALSNRNDSTLPTLSTYRQYKNLLGITDPVFKFGPSSDTTQQYNSPDIYVISFNRARYKQAIDAGNWQLSLSGSSGVKTFIDNSGLGQAARGDLVVNNVYDVMQGTIAGGTIGSTYYGKVYPDYGLIVLNPQRIAADVGFTAATENNRTANSNPYAAYTGSITSTGYPYQYQHEGLVRSISGSMSRSSPFIARSVEQVKSINYFIRAFNNEFNYTNNPTMITGSAGQVLPDFRLEPKTYITTVGLYNTQNELLAVAKLSKPLQKGRDKEATIRVRLDF